MGLRINWREEGEGGGEKGGGRERNGWMSNGEDEEMHQVGPG